MKKVLSVILAAIMFTSTSFCSIANELEDNDNADGVEVVTIGEGHEIVYYEGITIEDITTESYREIITCTTTDVSRYYEDFSTGRAILSVNGVVVETYDMDDLRQQYTIWQMPEEDLELIEKCLIEQADSMNVTLPLELQSKYTVEYDPEGTVIRPISDSSVYAVRAASQIIKPAGNVETVYPMYTNNQVSKQSRYSASCGRYLDMSVKDSMINYSQTTKKSFYYNVGTAVSVIAGALKIASSTLIGSLAGAYTVISGVLTLNRNIDYYFSESYSFLALRRAYIYDYSYNNREVSVYTESGNGEISMTWDYINNEYTNPAYKITGIAYPHTISYNAMYDKAKEIWEFNMQEYGWWKWGDV